MQTARDPVTRSEIVGWCITVVLVMHLLLLLGYLLGGTISYFRKMFESLGGTLPTVTRAYLALGDAGIASIFIVLAAIPVIVMVRSRSDRARLAVPIVCAVAFWTHLQLLMHAIIDPILELQKQMS